VGLRALGSSELELIGGDLKVSGTKTLEPTVDIVDALKRDYALEAGIADLVDNSIDADARHVLIRFIRRRGRLVSLCVVDDGNGMDDRAIDAAMQFARKRKYAPTDLGMFGMGLKAASLSQADVLSVMSRSSHSGAVGRQWSEKGIKKGHWKCAVLDPAQVRTLFHHRWGPVGRLQRGTIVRWDRVREFDRLKGDPDPYLHKIKVAIRNHLGLKLHRFLSGRGGRRVSIQIDVEDVATQQVFPPSTVAPLIPFPPKSAGKGYPRVYEARDPEHGRIRFRAHIWPKKSRDDGYKLGGGKVAEHQGFFFFRHNRLIQDGGWNGWIATCEPHSSLARVEVDIPDNFASYLTVRPNKAGIDVPATFAGLVEKARSREGGCLGDFVTEAQTIYRTRGELRLRTILRPGNGVPAAVREALERQRAVPARGRGIDIRWGRVTGREFFAIDRDTRELILNSRLRKALLNGQRGGSTDLPILRTALYLLLNSTFEREHVTSVEKARVKYLSRALSKAAELEIRRQYD
jgi:hypothetical protein